MSWDLNKGSMPYIIIIIFCAIHIVKAFLHNKIFFSLLMMCLIFSKECS